MTSQELSVTIDDEEYQLNITPTSKQRLVMQAREMLLEEIEMNTLASDLRLVGSFVRLSYNAVGAAGPKYTTVQIEIQTLGFDITKLCDTSALTLGLFRSSARTILDTLHSTYEFLLSGLEDVAADNFYSIKKLAQDMEKAARELHSKFDSQVSKTEDVLKNVQKAKGEAALESERMQKEREKTEQERKIADDLRMKAAKKEQEAEAQVKEEELKVEQASENIGRYHCHHEKCKKEHQDAAEKCKKERVEMMEKLVKFANSLSSLSTEKEFSDKAVTSLHEAISALKHLAAIMLHAANFWIILEKHCETLHNYGLGDLMQKYMAKDESVRKRLWISAPFKKQAVQFCCRWVVLYDVCTDYLEPLKETRAELYKYITENPTWEQSKQNVQELAKVFAETVNKVKQLDAKPLESQPETENAV
eukprot:Em0690g1a